VQWRIDADTSLLMDRGRIRFTPHIDPRLRS
jgi:hypothetical protein